jgi:hypothetical protein
MTSQDRQAIELKIGRALRAEEIGRGSITRREDRTLRQQIAAANQSAPPEPRWIETAKEYDGATKRETPDQFRKRMRESREQRTAEAQAAADKAAKLANDPTYNRMNEVAAQSVERIRWDQNYPQSAWIRALAMQQAARADDRDTFQALNKEHVEYLESVTNERQSAIDGEIARLQQVKQSFAEDRYAEPLSAPNKSTYAHIKRASGMMQLINNVDGHIVEYDPRVPGARDFAEQKLVQHQADTADKYGEPIPVQL